MTFEEQALENARHQREWAEVVKRHKIMKRDEAIAHVRATRGDDPNLEEWVAEAMMTGDW